MLHLKKRSYCFRFYIYKKEIMANSTPSSVLYELAKSNKLSVHYQVVSETGPAHQKVYNIHLRVGSSGPFEGVGNSLKSARNAAASRALSEGFQGLHINPTVELNILSMKSGEVAAYRELESMSVSSRSNQFDSLFMSQHYHSLLQRPRNFSNMKRLWRMSVTICGRTYVGEGRTKSEARGNAASHALRELKPLLMERAKMIELEIAKQKQAAVRLGKDPSTETLKSPCFVSKLHELANRHRMEISFQSVNETGPPHVRIFYVKCKVGEHELIGQGIGKRAAKNDAAEKMLEQLKDLPPPEPKKTGGKHRQNRRKPDKKKVDNGIDPSLTAVAYLNQLMNVRKENTPEYTLKADAGPSQKGLMRFQIEASIEDFKAAGYGETKKAAKSNAATNLLKTLGIDLEELRKAKGVQEKKGFSDDDDDDETEIINIALDALKNETAMLNNAHGKQTAPRIALSKVTLSQVNETLPDASAKQKVDYIATKEGFQVLYNDFIRDSSKDPQGVGEFSSSLAVFTTPPEVFHGIGKSVESSREDAARKALRAMQEKES